VHRSEKNPRFQRQLDKRPLSPGTSREASGVFDTEHLGFVFGLLLAVAAGAEVQEDEVAARLGQFPPRTSSSSTVATGSVLPHRAVVQ